MIAILTSLVNRFKRPTNKPREDDQITPPPPEPPQRRINFLPWDPDFPHEWQEEPYGCGAAAFSMVYKALGHPVPQSIIYKSVAVPDRTTGEGFTCLTWLLYLDALKRGFHALHVQVINPIEMLKDCYEHSIKAIIHQRAGASSIAGHASALIGINDESVYVHCSANGPRQIFSHNEILERMAPFRVSDVGLGNCLTLISNPLTERHTCKECDTEIPEFIECPNPTCRAQIRLSPSEPLGCINPECYGHKWIDIMCPHCMQGIRQIEKDSSVPAVEWEKTKKERQDKIEERKKRISDIFKYPPITADPSSDPFTYGINDPKSRYCADRQALSLEPQSTQKDNPVKRTIKEWLLKLKELFFHE